MIQKQHVPLLCIRAAFPLSVKPSLAATGNSFVLPFCGKSAADMAFLLVNFKYILHTRIKFGILQLKPLADIFMDSALGNAEMSCGSPDSSLVLSYVISEHYRSPL